MSGRTIILWNEMLDKIFLNIKQMPRGCRSIDEIKEDGSCLSPMKTPKNGCCRLKNPTCPKPRRPRGNGKCRSETSEKRQNRHGDECCYKKPKTSSTKSARKTCPKPRRPMKNGQCKSTRRHVKQNKQGEPCCYVKNTKKLKVSQAELIQYEARVAELEQKLADCRTKSKATDQQLKIAQDQLKAAKKALAARQSSVNTLGDSQGRKESRKVKSKEEKPLSRKKSSHSGKRTVSTLNPLFGLHIGPRVKSVEELEKESLKKAEERLTRIFKEGEKSRSSRSRKRLKKAEERLAMASMSKKPLSRKKTSRSRKRTRSLLAFTHKDLGKMKSKVFGKMFLKRKEEEKDDREYEERLREAEHQLRKVKKRQLKKEKARSLSKDISILRKREQDIREREEEILRKHPEDIETLKKAWTKGLLLGAHDVEERKRKTEERALRRKEHWEKDKKSRRKIVPVRVSLESFKTPKRLPLTKEELISRGKNILANIEKAREKIIQERDNPPSEPSRPLSSSRRKWREAYDVHLKEFDRRTKFRRLYAKKMIIQPEEILSAKQIATLFIERRELKKEILAIGLEIRKLEEKKKENGRRGLTVKHLETNIEKLGKAVKVLETKSSAIDKKLYSYCIQNYERLLLLQDALDKKIPLWETQLKSLGRKEDRETLISEVKEFMEENNEESRCNQVKKCSKIFEKEEFKTRSHKCTTLKQKTAGIIKNLKQHLADVKR